MQLLIKNSLVIAITSAILLKSFGQCLSHPKINFHSFDHILNGGDNFTVVCEGNAPLEWIIPEVQNEEYLHYTNTTSILSKPNNDGYTEALELTITNMTYLFVGFYMCREMERKDVPPAAIYLYVNDEKHPAVSDRNNSDKLIYTVIKNFTRIPCRPTSPDVEVTLVNLMNENTIPIKLNVLTGDKYYGYSPFQGIITNDTAEAKNVSLQCQFRKGSIFWNVYMHIVVEIVTYSLDFPSIKKLQDYVFFNKRHILRCQVRSDVHVDFYWKTLYSQWIFADLTERNGDIYYSDISLLKSYRRNIQKICWCKVKDRQGHESVTSLHIIDEGRVVTPSITISDGSIYVQGNGISLECLVKFDKFIHFTWLNDKNEDIIFENQDNFRLFILRLSKREINIKLTMTRITSSDVGTYTLVVTAEDSEAKMSFFVTIPEEVKLELKLAPYQILLKPTSVSCIISGFPKPYAKLEFKPCFDESCNYTYLNWINRYINETAYILNASIDPIHSGKIRCYALHFYGIHVSTETDFYVSDIENGFGIKLSEISYQSEDETVILTTENSVTLSCGTYIQNFRQSIEWRKNAENLHANGKYTTTEYQTEFSNSTLLTIHDLGISEEGIYTCILYKHGHVRKKEINRQYISIYVARHVSPYIIYHNFNDTTAINEASRLELICEFSGTPQPNISWYKDGDILSSSDDRVIVDEKHKKVTFVRALSQDGGTYRCEGSNEFGKMIKTTMLSIHYEPGSKWKLILIGVLTLLVVLGTLITCYFRWKKKQLEKLLLEAGLFNFNGGRLEDFDPALNINDQAELLPYDMTYEFPIQNLVLGETLGTGAFGIVLKGEAKRILPGTKITTVAVKMLHHNANQTHIKALVSELKILIHLGKHLNVVNLLGACTRYIMKGKILMIVEYCRYGNMHSYLHRHKGHFVDQINPKTGELDFSIGIDWDLINCASTNLEDELVDAGYQERNSEINKETECGIHNWEYSGTPLGFLSTKTLISWAFQVARGMEYLVSKRVMHGDLAARNILLTDQNIVKISDFGLSKTMYTSDNYKKMSDVPLPIKWMAIESIRYGVFSTHSDIWSFGILLWELFSLSETPYPGIEADEKLFAQLDNGYRMDPPKLSTKSLYEIMLDCWSAEPLFRPSFEDLENRLGFMLEESVKQHYIELNHPYTLMNCKRFENEKNGYLKMANAPNFQEYSSVSCPVEVQISKNDFNVDSYVTVENISTALNNKPNTENLGGEEIGMTLN